MVFSYTATTENGALDSRIDPSDPMAREAQTFPIVSGEMAARIARYGSEERFEARAPVFSRGDRSVDFFVVIEGSIEIFDVDEHDQPQVFAVLRANQFAGELDLFNDRQVLVSGRAGEASRILRVKRADFRRLVSTESDIGEIVMRAFILRRVGLIRHVHGGVIVVGPAHTADTLRLQQFLSRNAYPHRLLDTERDAEAGGFLECFSLTAGDLPVVIAPGHRVLRNPTIVCKPSDAPYTAAARPAGPAPTTARSNTCAWSKVSVRPRSSAICASVGFFSTLCPGAITTGRSAAVSEKQSRKPPASASCSVSRRRCG